MGPRWAKSPEQSYRKRNPNAVSSIFTTSINNVLKLNPSMSPNCVSTAALGAHHKGSQHW